MVIIGVVAIFTDMVYYTTCANGEIPGHTGCVGIQNTSEFQLDVRVTFRDGGICENETIRILTITHNGQSVYTCPNLGSHERSLCTPNGKFTVENPSSCASDDDECLLNFKYNIFLHFVDFNRNDTGSYKATISFGDPRSGEITKNFNVQMPGMTCKAIISDYKCILLCLFRCYYCYSY